MIEIKNATRKNLDTVIKLENEVWPEGTRSPIEKFENRLKIFPKGFFLAYNDGRLIGVSTSQRISYDGATIDSWEKVTDHGWIRTHNSFGNALYVVSVGSISRSGGGSVLIQAQKKLAKDLGLDYLVLGSRIPGYDTYCINEEEIPIESYIKLKREDGEYLDPELRFYTRNGLSLREIKSNYMEDDKESRNYGAIMIWKPSG